MSYQQGFIDALTIVWDECTNYSDIKTFKEHFVERTLKKAVLGKIDHIKHDLELSQL